MVWKQLLVPTRQCSVIRANTERQAQRKHGLPNPMQDFFVIRLHDNLSRVLTFDSLLALRIAVHHSLRDDDSSRLGSAVYVATSFESNHVIGGNRNTIELATHYRICPWLQLDYRRLL